MVAFKQPVSAQRTRGRPLPGAAECVRQALTPAAVSAALGVDSAGGLSRMWAERRRDRSGLVRAAGPPPYLKRNPSGIHRLSSRTLATGKECQ